MIDILSLPRRPNVKNIQIRNEIFKSGLPINSLPGWERIPLNLKLPMLKCPGNQVIFSKNKIGHSFRHLKQEFDPSGRDSFPEYNPLHDSNLKTFYANERNLKRLRENGEITETNDVICNLKDFNEYRQQLHKSQLYYIQQELNRLGGEQRDRMLIANAEAITNRDHRNLSARQLSYNEILLRKKQLDTERHNRYAKLLEKTEEKFERIAGQAEMQKVLIEHKKVLNHMKMQQHWEASNDVQRKHLISLKKLFQFKKDRLQKNLRIQAERRVRVVNHAQIVSWEKRMNERITNQQKIETLLNDVAIRRRVFIENHAAMYKEKWTKIQKEIKLRSRALKRKKPKNRKRVNEKKKNSKDTADRHQSFCSEYAASFDKLLNSELCEALNAALDMQAYGKIPFNPDDPIYKAAKFIMTHIIKKFNKDLSCDAITFKNVALRMDQFFDEAKKFVLFRATQIVTSARQSKDTGDHMLYMDSFGSMPGNQTSRRLTLSKYVAFSCVLNTIGTSSYEIHPLIDVKDVANRTPTPPGSLASIVVESEESLINKTQISHLDRNDMVFVEHFIAKFKRELIVSMGRHVFGAIQRYFDHKSMEVRKDLLELDKQFLVYQTTKAILGHAINPLNFESCLKLCTSVLSSQVICSLQKHLLRPIRDELGTIPLKQSCFFEEGSKLRLYCHPR